MKQPIKKYYYLVHIQYIGFRYHGWQKQPGVKTVESMVEKTLGFVLGHSGFKILGASRTDAMVSANHSAFELFVNTPLSTDALLRDMNQNLPPDIRVLKIETVGPKFNIINGPKIKEYLYLFSFGKKAHPFSAPMMTCFQETLDIDLMKQGARLFEGDHNFRQYCTKPGPDTCFQREILTSRIQENTSFSSNFFPERSYAYKVSSKGFMRHQVRLMMGQLIRLGKGEIDLAAIEKSLTGADTSPLKSIAPASGLILNKIVFL